MQKTHQLTTESLDVPGVEVVGADSPKGGVLAGPFQAYEIELLRDAARGLRPRREDFIVAPEGSGFSIYRRARK